MNALTVKNLSFGYNEEIILDDVSFAIKEGTYVSLLGHNGSGKSTLAKLFIGLLPANSGQIFVSDLELNKDNVTKIRNNATIVFQNPDNQFIGVTVEDDIAFSLENRNVPRKEMRALIIESARKVGMESFLTKEPAYLSGGQKQRVAIADALVINPQILILDEATSMLDPKGKKEILDLIREMKKENPSLTVISITHDVEEAYLSDEVIILDKGKIAAQGKPDDIFTDKELVSKYELAVPFIISLKDKLISLGMDVSKEDTLESLGEKICQLK
ncbi:MAG: energy-coupling factor transporter ATPase [Bacilli bacterium]|nr:energy-coupling factor transporter ATPase [Bacilli bacterium]